MAACTFPERRVAGGQEKKWLANGNVGYQRAIDTAAAGLTQIPLLFLQPPLQLVLTCIAFGLAASPMLPAIVRLLRSHAPEGMDARNFLCRVVSVHRLGHRTLHRRPDRAARLFCVDGGAYVYCVWVVVAQ